MSLYVAFDLETHLIQPGLAAPPIVCSSWATEVGSELLNKNDTRDKFTSYFDAGYTFIGANIVYDFACLAAEWPHLLTNIFALYDEERVWDIQLAEKLHDIACGKLKKGKSYSLASICERYGKIGAKDNDFWRLRYSELENTCIADWPEAARQYPIDDVVNTLFCFNAQVKYALDYGTGSTYLDLPAQCRASFALHLGAIWGFRVDNDKVEEYSQLVESKRVSAKAELTRRGFYRESGNKNVLNVKRAVAESYGDIWNTCEQCAGLGTLAPTVKFSKFGKRLADKPGKKCDMCDGVGIMDCPAIPKTGSQSISCTRDVLEESDNKSLKLLANFGELDRAVTSYIPYLRSAGNAPLTLSPNNPLETGRVSYSGLIQLLPRSGSERECIIPRSGNVFYSVDYAGIELATHAQSCLNLFKKSKLAEALNAGQKPHDMLAAKIAGVSDAVFEAGMKEKNQYFKLLRQAAKPANFGFPGGMGALTLVLQQRASGPDTVGPDGTVYAGLRFCILMGESTTCGTKKVTEFKGRACAPVCVVCLKAAEILRNNWFAQWPENVDYFAYVNTQVRKKREIIQHVTGRIRASASFCQTANSLFQGLAADGAKRALYEVVKNQYINRKSPLFSSRTILFAHDELVGECREEIGHDVVTEVARVMVEQMRTCVPDVRVTAEPTLMRRWYKAAELTIVNGKVVPWEPK